VTSFVRPPNDSPAPRHFARGATIVATDNGDQKLIDKVQAEIDAAFAANNATPKGVADSLGRDAQFW
jgi:hypothetical protein